MTDTATPTFPARGAEVTITPEGVRVTRTSVSTSLYSDATIAASELLGWNRIAPDTLSPGRIELLTRKARTVVNFSPLQTEEFRAIDARLRNLQAGYPLERGVGADGAGAGAGGTAGRGNTAATAGGTGTGAGGAADAQGATGSAATAETVSGDEWLASPAAEETGAAEVASSKSTRSRGAKRTPAPWESVATPDEIPATNTDADIDNPIYGQNVTVTGDVEPYDKGHVWNLIAQSGGTVGKNVTKKTTMLVVGEWATTTSKEKRARELQEKGQDIEIVSFDDFLRMVGEK